MTKLELLTRKIGLDYWTNYNSFRLIRGTNPNSFRYKFATKVIDFVQDIISFPSNIYYNIDIYISNRFIDKIHYLRTGLPPGEYYDLDYRILHGLFNELVIHVESGLAHRMKAYPERNYKFVKGRCKQAGIDYLTETMREIYDEDTYGFKPEDEGYGEPTLNSITASKIYELYNWWLDREYRVDPFKYFKGQPFARKRAYEMIEAYDEEDTKMLIELIKIRNELWT